MKNKKLKLGILVMAAVTVFTATAFAAGTTNEGYDTLKQIIADSERNEKMTNASLNGFFKISDNGTVIAEMTGTAKANHDDKEEVSGNVKVSMQGKKQDLSFYHTGEEAYIADQVNEKYYKLENIKSENKSKYRRHNGEEYSAHKMSKAEENFLDYLMGDLKAQIELSQNSDGTKTITMDLNQNEIPVALNLLTAVAASHKDSDNYGGLEKDNSHNQVVFEKLPFMKDFCEMNKDAIPVLRQDVKLTALVFKLNVASDNHIKGIEASVDVTGKDADGISHDILFQSSVSVSDINKTKVDEFNQAGKNLEIINAEDLRCGRE